MTADFAKSVLVYDVGGSHVACAVCLDDGYRLGPVASAHYPAEQTPDAFVGLLHSLGVQASIGFEVPSGAEIAVPGPFDFAAGISLMRHKLPYLYDVDLHQAASLPAGRSGISLTKAESSRIPSRHAPSRVTIKSGPEDCAMWPGLPERR